MQQHELIVLHVSLNLRLTEQTERVERMEIFLSKDEAVPTVKTEASKAIADILSAGWRFVTAHQEDGLIPYRAYRVLYFTRDVT